MGKIIFTLATFITLLTIFYSFKEPVLMVSPGHVSKGHMEIERHCFSCHELFKTATSEKCIVCHKVAEIGALSTKGLKIDSSKKIVFHKELNNTNCMVCHVGHIGHIQVKGDKSFKNFSHDLLGENIKSNCSSCHSKPTDSFHASLVANCLSCHTTQKWVPSSFDHNKYFKFDQNHTKADCNACHQVKNDYSKYTCYGCHEHSELKIRSEHQEEGINNYTNCIECHRSGNKHEGNRGNSNDKNDDDD